MSILGVRQSQINIVTSVLDIYMRLTEINVPDFHGCNSTYLRYPISNTNYRPKEVEVYIPLTSTIASQYLLNNLKNVCKIFMNLFRTVFSKYLSEYIQNI